jgi:hypothetical protein
MAADIRRVVLAAVEAARGEEKRTKKKVLSAGPALAVGAALAVVGRVAVGPGARFVRDKVQERWSDGPESEDAEDQAEEQEAELEQEEEPEAEFEEDEEPEAELHEDEEPEAELHEDEEPEAELDQEEEPEAEVQEADEPEALRPSTTRPHPPIFDRPGPRRSPVKPSRRPPRPKGDSDQEPKLSAPRRPRRPRAPISRT